MMNVQRPLFSHFQHEMIRPATTGSFTVTEDHIIVPTPRKIRNLNNSPLPKRKNTQENVLFGEAGQELHTILFQGSYSDSSDAETSEEEILEIIEMRHKHQQGAFYQENGMPSSPKFPRFEASPPVRSSNPITLNSPFYHNVPALEVLPQMRIVNSRVNGKLNSDGVSSPLNEQENASIRRYRSSSWPAASKVVTSE